MLRSSQAVPLTLLRRASYALPRIPVLESLRAAQEDFSGLYSNKSINDLWFQRGEMLTHKLNTQLEKFQVKDAPSDINELIAATFSNPELAPISNAAALLHNLQFSLESVKPNVTRPDVVAKADSLALFETPLTAVKFANEPRDAALREWLEDLFGSIAEFRTLLLNSANALKGDGYTWLVAQAAHLESAVSKMGLSHFSQLSVINTYNAGIVDDLIRSSQVSKLKLQKQACQQAVQEKRQRMEQIENGDIEEPAVVEKELELGSVAEAEDALLYSDRKVVPLLAIDALMRAYLHDYGVYGKAHYLENVWNCIDWDVAARRMPPRFKLPVNLYQ